MTLSGSRLPRAAYAAVAGVVVFAILAVTFPTLVHAATTQMPNRSIEMSDSGVSGGTITTGVGSGTNVDYKVTFDNPGAFQSLVVDFCGTSPLIGDTCDNSGNTAAFSATSATLDASAGTINTGAGWSLTASQYSLKLTGTSSIAAGGTGQSFTIHGVTNPAVLGTFFARIYTYDDSTYGGTAGTAWASPVAPGTYDNYGGIALSTAQIIQITAKVQEQLTFCVSGDVDGSPGTDPLIDAACDQATAPSLTLGHGTPQVLDNSQVDTANAYTKLSTNALHGVAVRMHNANACGGLSVDGGITCDIPAINSGAAGVSAMSAGTAAFGLFVADSTADSSPTAGIGTVSPTTNYSDGNASHYGMYTDAATGVSSTYGDVIEQSLAPVSNINNALTFAATASLTTPAGIYTANMALIATGTF